MPSVTNLGQGFRFDVAFSFAGPHREKVLEVANRVAASIGKERVFFDEWYQHEILGDDMDVLLQRFYHEQSLFVVADLSEEYSGREWGQAEARAIRALRFEIDPARDEIQRLRLLNVRFGPGEVPGVYKTTGYFNGIDSTVDECADLILKRLALLRERLALPVQPVDALPRQASPAFSWPETSPSLPIWPMADHTEARAAFERLLTRNAPWRSLPLRGSSETGKSHITRQMLANAIQMPDLACGRFDFKGTTDVDAELRAFVQYLDVPLPPVGPRLNERLTHILDALKLRAKPALLIFDTYEAAGEAQDWMEKQLLLRVMRDTWVRVVIAGQTVPEPASAVWATVARPPLQLMPPPPEEWCAFGRLYNPDINLDFVRQAHQVCKGKASVLAQLLGA
jgi:hypothetical protein